MKFKRISFFIISFLSLFSPQYLIGREIIEIDPLFEYPTAPEELELLTDKSNYLVKHFWEGFDFKNKQAVDQNALNDAFLVFSTPLRWADLQVANQSVDRLIDKISGNPTLLLQFTKAAEEVLYGPRAEIWVDEVYLKFVDACIRNKKISDSRKEKFNKISRKLHNTARGEQAPTFSFENKKGETAQYFPMSTPTLIIFGNPVDTDWRLARLRMETNSALSQALEKGKLNILFIIPTEMENWKESVSNYSDKWVVGQGVDILDTIDIRVIPSIYVIGSDGKILMKNVALDSAIATVMGLIENPA